jgi:putative two-component system response regulator
MEGCVTEETKILIVDDEKRILEMFAPLLEDFGYCVRTASNAEDAMVFAGEIRFDVVFIDQCLGPVKGMDLLKKMNAAAPGFYYVIMTGCGSTDLAVEVMRNGAADFLSKPFFVSDMIKSVEYIKKLKALDRKRSELLVSVEATAKEKETELKNIYLSILSSLALTMEKKDIGTYGHSRRVSYYARLIAAVLDLNEEDRVNLKAASLLHDIGKIGITDFILGKNGRLSPGELDEVKSHPLKGVEILKPLKQFRPILPAILHHHESYDGAGYPDGLAGEKIPLLARIITVADTYDAILSDRPYRSAATHEYAVEELEKFSGKQFDPGIVKAFISVDKKYRIMLSDARRDVR